MTSHADSIKQLTAALEVAKDRLDCLKEHGLTHHQVWYAPSGTLALADKSKSFGLPISADDPIYLKVRKVYLSSSITWSKPESDDLREYNRLDLIREGFAKKYKCPETRASLNKMLDDIHAFWIKECKAFITAKEKELSQMM